MNYLNNQLLILIIQILNKFGRGFDLKKKIFSSQKILERNFHRKKEFNFIQVGANDGISFDFLYEFVITRKSSGVVIEPVSDYFKELVNNYKDFPDIIKINKAIHSFEKSKKIFKIKNSSRHKYYDWVKGIASFDENHHNKTNISKEDMEEEHVQADTLMNIITDFYSNKKIDYLQVDTEGYDLEILKMLDYTIIKPLIIKYEHSNLDKADINASKKLLIREGYSLFNEGNDTVGIDLCRIKLI
ncbi:FkbM family methyltransferase [Gillisia hiemivivida]|uniref:FkbM family methyltransferase n=1 Tax=Gillisia hiemivivida TaxID=291190 RepID=A0A5C6ZVE4_9FLAO|nr:FkbM family methyltransferase [Gillisia hiemivivida]TXD93880.1 FkbM family methyltransferase [Gillisia hiemivivida]